VFTNIRYFWRLSKKRKLPAGSRRRRDGRRHRAGRRMGGDEILHALHGVQRHFAPVTQPAGELAVVDGAAAQGGFGHPGAPAVVGNVLQQNGRVHAGSAKVRNGVARQ
jgi:hypothetical protein